MWLHSFVAQDFTAWFSLIHQDQGMLDLSQAGTLLRMSLEDLVQMNREPPVQGFLR